MHSPFPHFARFLLVVSVVLAVGCRQEEIQVYRVSREKLPPPVKLPPPAAAHDHGHRHLPLDWQAPAHWEEQAPGNLRLATYRVPGTGGVADLSISNLTGDGGGLLANVNRWRGQLQLAPLTEASLPAALSPVKTPVGQATVLDLRPADAEPASQGTLVAILGYQNFSWYFKLSGPVSVLDDQREAFMQLLASLRPHAEH